MVLLNLCHNSLCSTIMHQAFYRFHICYSQPKLISLLFSIGESGHYKSTFDGINATIMIADIRISTESPMQLVPTKIFSVVLHFI